ncbi:Erythronolide synthase [Cladobotryum mycophilum]|uniref:Erythronolide synthase n=1 Tax=Cladobotryum mycophilum TaxID=491253 RepID=A0ABR0SY28_9HYPO
MITPSREPIAVVGIGCRFPGGVTTVKAFWETLRDGIDKLSEVPADRFDASSFYDDQDPRKYGSIRNHRGGFVDDIYEFDADFFGFYPAEASRIDPQQRIALEVGVHALEDSGTTLEQVAGSRTGVFLGNFTSDHLTVQTAADVRDNLSPHVALGPSLTIDTACSSSLVALHLACQSIWTHESDGALAGGVNAILRPESTIVMSKAGFLSPDGTCKSFDAAANGYVRSEGVGIVYLKPLSRAISDGDRIYSLIRGSLVNQDGYTPEGFTVPSVKAQSALLQSLYAQSGIDPAKVRYVEAHGPGTVVGDPIEARALGKQLGQLRSKDDEPLWIASLKGNFGHLEGAAGIAGFIKASLVTFHGAIPPQLNHKTPNPSIDFQSLRLAIPLKVIHLARDRKIWVGVNSFGAGGTNAHAILEEPPVTTISHPSSHRPRVFLLSARSESAMERAAVELASHLRHEHPSLENVAYTLNMRRSRHQHTSVIPATHVDELCSRLDILGSGKTSKDILTLQKRPDTSPKVAFVFSGQGGQWLGMGAALAAQEAVFRDSLADFDVIFTYRAGFSIIAEISAHDDPSRLNKTTIVQPAIAAIQIALARTLISYGVEPDAIAGHSIGEVAAAHIAGALSLEQAVDVIYFRSTIQSKASGTGSMLATGVSSTEAEQLIARRGLRNRIEIATLNGPKMTTLAGDTEHLKQLAEELQERGSFARFVNVNVPYHSRFMDPLEAELVKTLSKADSKLTNVPLYSTVTACVEPGTHLTGQYWFENVRKPVRYVETVTRMLADGYNFFIEIGPHPVLVSGTRGVAESAKLSPHILPAMVRENDLEPISRVIGVASALGVSADIQAFNGGGGRVVDLPLYAFQRQHYWFEHPEAKQHRLGKARHPFFGDSTSLTGDGRATLRLRLSTGVSPFLSEHIVDGMMVFPMTGHVEAAFLGAREHMPHEKNVWLEDLRFEHPVVLASAEDFAPQILFEITSPAKDFVIASRPADSTKDSSWQICSRGRINSVDQSAGTSPEAMESVKNRVQAGTKVRIDHFYRTIDKSGLRYGEAFRAIKSIWRLGNEIFSYAQLSPSYQHEASRFKFHPALLDACCHTMFADIQHQGDPTAVYLPYHVDRVQIFDADGATAAFTHLQIRSRDETLFRLDASMYDENGRVLAVVTGLTAKRLQGQNLSVSREHRLCFQSEASQPKFRRADVDFPNILALDLQLPGFDWLSPVQRAFPNTLIHKVDLDTADTKWDSDKWGFRLDRRSLLIVPAVVEPSSNSPDLCMTAERIYSALRRVASWIHKQQGTSTVIVLTRGGCMTPMDSQCNPLSSSVEAAVRVMVTEFPQARIRVVDLALNEMSEETTLLEEELRTFRLGRDDTIVAIRPESRFYKELVTRDLINGSLDGIIMRQQAPINLGPDEVAIEIHAAGLNYKDVMNGLGLLSERATAGGLGGQELGIEVAGRVLQMGGNVRGLDVGVSVMGGVANGLAGLVVTDYRLVVPLPSSLTMAEAACVPVVYLTAYYALVYLGRMGRGDSVLIHAGAGGVGVAAIQMAQHFGARVFATAGSPERRARVSEMGVEGVFDSRSPSFHDEVKKATGGLGVDLVLNSLIGPLFTQSLACLAPFGRFLEIGKTDIYQNMPLGLEQFGDNRSFFAIDLDRLARQKPQLYQRMLNEVRALFEAGQLMPPLVTKYPITEVSTALQTLSRSAVVGKVAIEMPEDTHVDVAPLNRLQLHGNKSYLITGGTTGFGIHLARFLDQAIVANMQQQGAVVTIKNADVNDTAAITSLFKEGISWPPVAGVIHCAGVVQSAFCYETTTEDFWNVFGPKAIGAWNMHLATQDKDLDFFIMTSSISAIIGITSGFSYAAANQFLDSLAHHRRSLGLPGLSLNLGVLEQYAGMVGKTANPEQVVEDLTMQGMSLTCLPAALSLFERMMLQDATQRLALGLDFSIYLKAHPHLLNDGLYLGLGSEREENIDSESSRSMANLSGPERLELIAETLHAGLAKLVGLEPSRISVTERIDQYAFDSLILTQLRGMILREFQVTYALMRLFQGPSLLQIAEELHSSLSKSSADAQASTELVDSQSDVALPKGLTVLSPWLIRGTGSGRRVICFHAMGGAASQFNHFLLHPPEGMDPIAVQLPGRESRVDEPMPATISEIIEEVARQLEDSVGPADVLWGHSMGGIIAFEVIRVLRRQGKPLPRLMIMTTIAPQLAYWLQRREQFLQSSVHDYSAEYMVAVSQYVEGADFAMSILPMMRKDAPLLLEYQFTEEEALDVPITAIVARKDDVVYPEEVAGWAAQTKQFNLIEMDGNHWSVQNNHELLWKAIRDLIAIE